MNTSKVARIEVIDHSTGGKGRILVVYDKSVYMQLQDDDRTLKIFLGDKTNQDARGITTNQ